MRVVPARSQAFVREAFSHSTLVPRMGGSDVSVIVPSLTVGALFWRCLHASVDPGHERRPSHRSRVVLPGRTPGPDRPVSAAEAQRVTGHGSLVTGHFFTNAAFAESSSDGLAMRSRAVWASALAARRVFSWASGVAADSVKPGVWFTARLGMANEG